MGQKKISFDGLSLIIKDPKKRAEAWQTAYKFGSKAVIPLAKLMDDRNHEIAIVSKRALWKLIHYVGRPEEGIEKKKVISELLGILKTSASINTKREILWMISEIGGDESIKSISAFLSHKDLKNNACMVLEHIPGKISLSSLKAEFKKASNDFKYNIAQSLRKRGEKIKGYPCKKLIPVKGTK